MTPSGGPCPSVLVVHRHGRHRLHQVSHRSGRGGPTWRWEIPGSRSRNGREQPRTPPRGQHERPQGDACAARPCPVGTAGIFAVATVRLVTSAAATLSLSLPYPHLRQGHDAHRPPAHLLTPTMRAKSPEKYAPAFRDHLMCGITEPTFEVGKFSRKSACDARCVRPTRAVYRL
jgi:hypothetical protein